MGVALGAVSVAMWFTALCLFDIRWRRLPNAVTLPGAVAVLIVSAVAGRGAAAVTGALALFGLYLAVHLLAPRAMGAGDVKLAIGVGALTGAFGADVWMLAALGAPLLTAVWALIRGVSTNHTVPHGPSMCLVAAAAVSLVVL